MLCICPAHPDGQHLGDVKQQLIGERQWGIIRLRDNWLANFYMDDSALEALQEDIPRIR